MSGWLLNVQYQAVIEQFLQPVFVTGAMTRLGDAMAILAEHNYGERHLFGARENGRQAGIIVSRGRQGIGIKNHCQTSRSICSNAASTRLSICLRSLCRCLSLPTCFIQGLSWDVVCSFSWTASVTSWRKGMPRWAAADFARRNRKSGISRVVFTFPYYHIYGSRLRKFPFCMACPEVKPRRDCTARESVWESTSLPALNKGHVQTSSE